MESLVYRGKARDLSLDPWLRLCPGRRYGIDKRTTISGKVRVRVSDGISSVKVNYKDVEAFTREWK